MAAVCVFVFFLCLSSVLPIVSSCPRPCSCSDKQLRHVAECSFKALTTIPRGLPPNVSTVSLSANQITSVPSGSFRNAALVTSLWMTQNMIISVERGAISELILLRNLDLSHNRLTDFPWEDLENLTSLQLLKLDDNKLQQIPRNAFSNLKELNTLRLNDNRIETIHEGTFDSLIAMSHLQLYHNPFSCTCSLSWIQNWIMKAKISFPYQNLTICDSPEELQGVELLNVPALNCEPPVVTINIDNNQNGKFYEGSLLVLTCEFTGNPQPIMRWKIYSKKELALMLTENDSAEMLDDSLKVYDNGTIEISELKKEDSGIYSCSAKNENGEDEKSVVIEVLASSMQEELTSAEATQLPTLKATNSIQEFNLKGEDKLKAVSKCRLTPNTKYVYSNIDNASFDDVKQYTFNFGVIALGVTETDAIVRLTPLLKSKEWSKTSEEETSNGISLCLGSDAVQWTHIKEGINGYRFAGLRPGTNYSLCLTFKGEECKVQVHFATIKRIPNLIIIISVSICLLTVSTVPLLGATCYHLVYKYHSQTYRMILKARGRYNVEKASFGVETESEKGLRADLAEEEEVTDSGEKDTEESIVVETTSVDRLMHDCELGSEYSDRLPLGAEADNITD